MATNQLTGDFDAVVQIALRQINGLLATLHQNGANENAPLRLLHSVRLPVGVSRRPLPDLGGLGDWVVDLHASHPRIPSAAFQEQLVATAPPGAAARLTDALAALDDLVVLEPTPVRGTVDAQVGSVQISFPAGSTSEVTIHAPVRALYRPAPNTADLPAPIHGALRATFDVRKVPSSSGRQLTIRPSADDNKIQFVPAPGSGIDPVEASRLSSELRKVLRNALKLLPVDLPPEFPFAEFKGVAFSVHSGPAVALPLQLSDTPAPPGAIHGITQSIVGNSGFAFAVRPEFVASLIDLDAIRAAIKRRRIRIRFSTIFGGSYTITYTLRFTGDDPKITFRAGGIEISGNIAVETGSLVAPNGFVDFKQLITLSLDADTQKITPVRVGDPDVDESWFIPHGRAKREVTTQIDAAISSARDGVRQVFDDARRDLRKGLQAFDTAASALYTGVEITPDGIIVRGEITTAARPVPVVDVRETTDGTAFTAFRSWIPAGAIHRFVWSWVDYSGPLASILNGVVKTAVEEHGFILPKPPGVTNRSSICLSVQGVQFSPGGGQVPIAGGATCQLPEFGTILEVPAWFEPVNVPIWLPDVSDRSRVRDALAAHVTVQSTGAAPPIAPHNTLVYFADWRGDRPLEALGAALAPLQRRPMSLAIIVVVPKGAFDERRKELEAKLSPIGAPFAAHLHITEDDEGGWTRTFLPERVPATFLIDARRRFVWKHDGTPVADELSAVLARHLLDVPPMPWSPLRLRAMPGDTAPDVFFEDDRDEYALHRFAGRRVVLNFWQAWSAPCLRELRLLQSQFPEAARQGTFVAGIHGGSRKGLERVRKELGIDFPLIDDAEQRTASAFGVRCWPTTVTIDASGRVEHVQFGVTHEHGHSYPTVGQPIR